MRPASTETEALSVEQLVRRIKAAVASVPRGEVEAEIESVTRARSGHVYLTLAGSEDARVHAVIWRRNAESIESKLPVPLDKGQQVRAGFDRVDFYGPRGDLKLFVSDIRPVGEGQLLARRQRDREQLEREGLTQRKRPLPAFPRTVGLVAGEGSDGAKDVVRGLRERFGIAEIIFIPTPVQGPSAPDQLIRAVVALDAMPEVEAIVVARGGGSVFDLVAFDHLELCRIFANTRTPTVAAIGHTANRPNLYEVADAHVDVPRQVAEVLYPTSSTEVLGFLDAAVASFHAASSDAGDQLTGLERLASKRRRCGNLEQRRTQLAAQASTLSEKAGSFYHHLFATLDSASHKIVIARRSAQSPQSLDRARAAVAGAVRAARAEAQASREELAESQRRAAQAGAASCAGQAEEVARLDQRLVRGLHAAAASWASETAERGGLTQRLRRMLTGARRVGEAEAADLGRLGQRRSRALTEARAAYARQGERIEGVEQRRRRALRQLLDHEYLARLERKLVELRAHDPAERGFALLRDAAGNIVDSVAALRPTQEFELEMHDGRARGRVLDVQQGGSTDG